jgi:hypothetical protein
MTPSDSGSSPDDELIDFGPSLQRYLAGDPQALDDLPPRERALADRLAPLLAAARHQANEASITDSASVPTDEELAHAPPLETDPIALALGLVAGPDDILDALRFKTARNRSRLDIKAVADRLNRRGWSITVKQVYGWQRSNSQLPPALLAALADTLAVSPSSLRARRSAARPHDVIPQLLDDEVIAAFLAEWAQEAGRTPDAVRAQAERTLAGASFRNESRATREDLLAVLRALRRLAPDGSTAGTRANPPHQKDDL